MEQTFLDFINQNQFLLLIIIAVIGIAAQSNVTSKYNKWQKIKATNNLIGKEVAEQIMHANGIYNVQIEMVQGVLSDHYDPRSKVVRLSKDVYEGNSIASQAIAAHEIGHVIQHHVGYKFLLLRNSFAPAAISSSRISMLVLFAGIIFSIPSLVIVGIVLMTIGLVFQIITLPVEFDASNRALVQLNTLGITTSSDQEGAKSILKAAALTYIVAALATVLQIIRLLSFANRD